MENKVCLVIIFNHRYDKNLPLLRKIYGERFSEIRFLMPFYDGADSDVIPVYESSWQFQGYFIQAYDKLKDIPCTHYLFIGDDLIINPTFDEKNFVEQSTMHDKKFLITGFKPLNSPNMFRVWRPASAITIPFYSRATTWKDFLCPYDEAMVKFKEFFGVEYKKVYDEEFFGDPNRPGKNMLGKWDNAEEFSRLVDEFKKQNKGSMKIPYPMAYRGGGSDIFCISKDSLFEFSRLCGIFSAMNLFVEMAIPTAAVLMFKRSEVAFFPNGTGLIMWNVKRTDFAEKYDRDFSRLYNEWDEKLIFVHPVKLSGWKNI